MSLRRVTPEEAHRLMRERGYVYLDVRTTAEFHTGHPQNAYNLPWQQPGANGLLTNPRFVDEVATCFDRAQPLVVGCATGVRSRAAAEALIAAGFSEVVEQRAGFEGVRDPFGGTQARGWRELGLPCATQPAVGHSYTELTKEG